MKRLHTHSQHFLRSPALVKELFGHSSIKSHETVIDIGAGSGVISAVLAQRVAKVIAVEVEPRTVEILKRNTNKFPNVTVYDKDFLSMPLPKEPYSIFANIPFHLSSPIIERLIFTDQPPTKAYLIVQRQFAKKLVSDKPETFTSQLGMLLGARYEFKIRKPLRKTDFWPHPAVDTVFLEIKLRQTPLVAPEKFSAYQRMTQECFSDPKKYLALPLDSQGLADTPPSRTTIDKWVALFEAQDRYR